MSRRAKQTGLVALMVLGGLMLWFGNPVIWLWIGSQMSETQRASMGPYFVVALGILASTIGVSFGLARVHRVYQQVSGRVPMVRVRLPWMRSVRGEEDSRPEVTVLDVVVVSTAVLGIAAALFWFLFLAGSSLPAARRVAPAVRSGRVVTFTQESTTRPGAGCAGAPQKATPMVLTRIAFGYFTLMLVLALVLPGH
jgi:hypothetical protein